MDKDIKDYLHLYLGCQVQWEFDKSAVFDFIGIAQGGLVIKHESGNGTLSPINYKTVKLLLYPLSYAVKEKIIISKTKKLHSQNIQGKPDDIVKLLHHEIDLFGLIESGLALDKTTFKK